MYNTHLIPLTRVLIFVPNLRHQHFSYSMRYTMNNDIPFQGSHTSLPERKCKVLPSIEADNLSISSKRRAQPMTRAEIKPLHRSASGRFTKTPRETKDVDVKEDSKPNGKPQIKEIVALPNNGYLEAEQYPAIGHMDWQLAARVEGRELVVVGYMTIS